MYNRMLQLTPQYISATFIRTNALLTIRVNGVERPGVSSNHALPSGKSRSRESDALGHSWAVDQ